MGRRVLLRAPTWRPVRNSAPERLPDAKPDSEESEEEELTEQERRNRELEEKTGAIVQTKYGECYRTLVISNTGDRDEPMSI
jgi:hypothetical protein